MSSIYDEYLAKIYTTIDFQTNFQIKPSFKRAKFVKSENKPNGSQLFGRKKRFYEFEIYSFDKTNVGDFKLQILEKKIEKRYSDFDNLLKYLKCVFKCSVLPQIPQKRVGKSVYVDCVTKDEREFGLFIFLNSLLLDPKFSENEYLSDFIFSVLLLGYSGLRSCTFYINFYYFFNACF